MMTIRTSDEFKSAYKRLKKKYKSLEADFASLLISLQENPCQGVEILEDIWKIRMNITSKGRGKSGGARIIVRARVVMNELQLLYIYDKADFENVSDAYLRDILKRM